MNHFSQDQECVKPRSFFDWFSSSEMKEHIHFTKDLVLTRIEVLQIWYTYNYNKGGFTPRFDFCNSETSNFSFVTQEGILVFDFQMCSWRQFFKLR